MIDLREYERVKGLLSELEPDLIYHLAAQASVARSWDDPAFTLTINTTIQLNILRAVAELGLSPRILVVASADEYGMITPEDLPVDEDTPLRPPNPYAVSKVTQDFLGYQYYVSHHLPIVRVRPFNHIGPRQGLGFVVPDFCKQIAEIEAGLLPPVMRTGNLSAKRDFTDVRDMVRGYHVALTRGTPGQVYNLGSSEAVAIQDMLDMLLEMSHVPITTEFDPTRMRPSDIPIRVCDCTRIESETGWRPERPLAETLRDALDDWRQRVRANADHAR